MLKRTFYFQKGGTLPSYLQFSVVFIDKFIAFTGGMQDFNYLDHGCMELTLEISCCKIPKASDLDHYWNDNKKVHYKIFPLKHGTRLLEMLIDRFKKSYRAKLLKM